ncbi:hypothetical protein K1719_045521 [Acacia pycnantha]|nr:hypothetical protein K1719_045521 [Acacia pycnantha]
MNRSVSLKQAGWRGRRHSCALFSSANNIKLPLSHSIFYSCLRGTRLDTAFCEMRRRIGLSNSRPVT